MVKKLQHNISKNNILIKQIGIWKHSKIQWRSNSRK